MAHANGVMMQYFHWYSPEDGSLWKEVAANAKDLAAAGITALWLPPAYKGLGGTRNVGYAVYDMYDLGEFDQQGTVRTKYGTRDEYQAAIEALHAAGVQAYADVVMNHRIGGDGAERVKATPFRQDDRLNPVGPQREITAYTHFNFPGRKGKYSSFEWHWNHFDATDYDETTKEKGFVYLFDGHKFDNDVALENGNFAYLMGCDLDFQNSDVRQEMLNWGKWYLDTTKVDGFRLDALKHISAWFFPEWIKELEDYAGKKLFVVGEYWSCDIDSLHWYLNAVNSSLSVFAVTQHYHFHYASKAGGNYDMRRLIDGTLMQQRPMQAVTFVDNHDSQPLQALESVVDPWFKPLAYATILLRQDGYPCIFYADYYGAEYEDCGRDGNRYKIVMPSHRELIDKLLYARKHYAYGPQYDYFDHWNRVGWTRLGNSSHPKAMAVLMSDGPEGTKWMDVGHSNAVFSDLLGNVCEKVVTNSDGWGEFRCNGGSVSVWVED